MGGMMFDLAQNPFLWQGVVFSFFGFVTGLAVHSLGSLPKHILDAL